MRLAKRLSIVAMAALVGVPAFAQRATLTDAQIRDAIIRDSVNAYLATGHPCACPYNTMRNGRACGARSAYSRPGGASPLCYPRDVSDAQVREWLARHPAETRQTPPPQTRVAPGAANLCPPPYRMTERDGCQPPQ
jgi:hypothetical protein